MGDRRERKLSAFFELLGELKFEFLKNSACKICIFV